MLRVANELARKMTKAERIRALYEIGEYTTREIADVIGCRTEYVRVVARQRKGGSFSEHDAAYLMKKYGGNTIHDAWRNRSRDPDWRESNRLAQRRFKAKRRAEARAS